VSARFVFVWGLVLWVASAAALALTEDGTLLPSVVLLGSFLVPVTSIVWVADHDPCSALSVRRLLEAFFIAGVLGLLAAALLETWLLPDRLLPNVWIGLIEEAVKAIGVLVLARGLPRYTLRDGILLGAAVGLGFGAFEAAGYTLTYGFTGHGFSLRDLISEEILRAVVAPFCHGVWTGLFGAALFSAHGRITPSLLLTYLGVAGLHALWDGASTAGIIVTVLIDGTVDQRNSLSDWSLPVPDTLDAQWLYGLVQWAIMLVVAVLGVERLRVRWRVHQP
jgi:RsiW-degrading membrane proteinase PrsW (M82 family)